MEPATIWTPKSGEGEYSATGNPNLDSEAGLDLLDELGNNLVQEDSNLTLVAHTAWTQANGT